MKHIELKNGKVKKELTIKEQGILSGYRALEFKSRLIQQLDRTVDNLLVDLTEASEVDLTCVNTLIVASWRAAKQNRTIRILSGQHNGLQRWLHLTKFDSNLNVQYLNA